MEKQRKETMKQTLVETPFLPFPRLSYSPTPPLAPSPCFCHTLRWVPASPFGEAMGGTGGWVGAWWFLAAAPAFFFPCSFLLTHSQLALVLHSRGPSGVSLLQCWSPYSCSCLRGVPPFIKSPVVCPPVLPHMSSPDSPAPHAATFPYLCQGSGARVPLTVCGIAAVWVGTDWDQHGAVTVLSHMGHPAPPATKALRVMPICSPGGRWDLLIKRKDNYPY